MATIQEAVQKNIAPPPMVAEVSAAKAVTQIARTLGVARSGAGGRDPMPGEVVQAARSCRAERDELRRQHSRHAKVVDGLRENLEREHGSASELKKFVEYLVSLEEILGDGTVTGSIAQRMEECCNAAAVCMAEVASLKRGYDDATASLEDARKVEASARERAEKQSDRLVECAKVERQAALLSEQLAAALKERDALCTELGRDPATLEHPSASQAATLAQFGRLEDEKAKVDEALKREQEQRVKLVAQLEEASKGNAAEIREGGSAAVRAAKKALHDKMKIQERADELAAKCAELEATLEQLKAAQAEEEAKRAAEPETQLSEREHDHVGGGGSERGLDGAAPANDASANGAGNATDAPGASAEQVGRTEADFENMRKRLYAFSREITYVTRERDQLLMQCRIYQQRLVSVGIGPGEVGEGVEAGDAAAGARPADGDLSRFPPIAGRRAMLQPGEGDGAARKPDAKPAKGAPEKAQKAVGRQDEWTGAQDRSTDDKVELMKMRKRVVALEREREKMQQQLQAQQRAAQLHQQNQERSASKARAVTQQLSELQALNGVLSEDLKQLRLDKMRLQSQLDEFVEDNARLLRIGDFDALDADEKTNAFNLR